MRTKEQIERLEKLTEALTEKVAALEKEIACLKGAEPSDSAEKPAARKGRTAAK